MLIGANGTSILKLRVCNARFAEGVRVREVGASLFACVGEAGTE
jgi:hypothetical protein